MRTSVRSVAGSPSVGSDWTKSVMGVACSQLFSSSTPSMTGGSVMRVAAARRIGTAAPPRGACWAEVTTATAKTQAQKKTTRTVLTRNPWSEKD